MKENNIINIKSPNIYKNRIDYEYEIIGEWKKAFKIENKFFVEYTYDISDVPEGIAIIPFVCNILPIAWLYDAEININCCDEDFYNCIDQFKKGYIEMYPMLEFKGKINVKTIQRNVIEKPNGVLSFFSGGVDAFNTLLNHIDEKPTMLTVWGADIKISDEEGWNNVLTHIKQTAEEFSTNYIIIKSNLRECFDDCTLTEKIKESKESWWHGFQHGIGIISSAAPIAYAMKKLKIYFASSFTAEDKGKYTCASDPTIDNYLKIANIDVIHDGYEYTRQDKVYNILKYCKQNNKKIKLRVCWQENKGKNCCECEKCWRTILEIIAENGNPYEFGLNYNNKQLKTYKKLYYNSNNVPYYMKQFYIKAQEKMRKDVKYDNLPKELKWFYNVDINRLFGPHPIYKLIRRIKNKIKRTFVKVKGIK